MLSCSENTGAIQNCLSVGVDSRGFPERGAISALDSSAARAPVRESITALRSSAVSEFGLHAEPLTPVVGVARRRAELVDRRSLLRLISEPFVIALSIPASAGPEHFSGFWARTAQGPARRPERVIWPCLDEHPPDCLPLKRNGCPRPDIGYLRTVCGRQGRKSQFHCDEQALTVAEVFSLRAGSVCARTPTSVAATPTNEHPRCSIPDPPAKIGKRPILQKHSEQTSANQIPGTGHLPSHRGYCAASLTTKMFTLPCNGHVTSWHRR